MNATLKRAARSHCFWLQVDIPLNKDRAAQLARKESYRAAQLANEAARIEAFCENARKATEAFENTFSHEDRRLIMARAYWETAATLAEQSGSSYGVQRQATVAGSLASAKAESTVYENMCDWRNNGGWFSPSQWGRNTKLASIIGDIDTVRWAREWVLSNMGHRKGAKNRTNEEFNRALHEHLGVEFIVDPKLRLIKPGCSLALLHKTGAKWTEHKTGVTFHDSHGADHVANKQRPTFLSLYAQLYARGPNFIQVDNSYIDKDTVPNHVEVLERDVRCLGPRGIHLGGQVNPNNSSSVLPFCRHIDHPAKVWIILCHDECCVHSLKEETHCWLIPGVEMGEMPTKSDGEILHLSEADAEVSPGCLSLDGTIGRINRKDLKEYIRAKHAKENPRIPLHSSIWMHAGKGNHQEGNWEGDDAAMHFELLMDQFDILFNLVDEVPDAREARANDILNVTSAQRLQFKYGMAIQIDRSQGHMKRNHRSLNTKNGDRMNTGCKGKQPHYKHTYSSKFPTGCSNWRQCRLEACEPNCGQCLWEVQQYGHDPTFQTIGRKGCDQVLIERGFDIKKMKKAEKLSLLDSEPDWGVIKSALAEMLEERGHFGLVGAACHAELAYKEHGWARCPLALLLAAGCGCCSYSSSCCCCWLLLAAAGCWLLLLLWLLLRLLLLLHTPGSRPMILLFLLGSRQM